MDRRLVLAALVLAALAAALVWKSTRHGAAAPEPPPARLLAAGDIASCSRDGDERTARLLATVPRATVAALGDIVYPNGSADDFAECYAPTWGREKWRTRPAVGNHEYDTPDADGYFDYFGGRAGERGQGWYSYALGAWHVVVLNSNCAWIGGCGAGSPQERWLRADLAAHRVWCTLAYWHHPRFSSGTKHGSDTEMQAEWQALYDAGADVVLVAHEHNYERFAPLNAEGRVDTKSGIREFVVGTGGYGLAPFGYPFGTPITGSEVRQSGTVGVLDLALRQRSYDWRFLAEPGSDFRDSGSGECH